MITEKLADATRPLAGLTVIELAAIGPVPFATHILRQMGARIIVVAPPQDRDIGLAVPPRHDYLATDKAMCRLDLKSAAGRDELAALLDRADVLVEGFRPGVLERLGLAPAELRARFPRLVLGRCSGWQRDWPCASAAGHDINYLALAGALAAIGADTPVPPLNLVGDYGGAAMHLVAGVLGALLRRERCGQGSVVDTSIVAGSASLMTMLYGLSDAGMWQPDRAANTLDGGAPYYRCYRTADDRWMALGAIEQRFFREFVSRIGVPVDVSRQHDRSYWPAMHSLIGDRMLTRTRDQWTDCFEGTDCCCTPVLDLDEARERPESRNLFTQGAPRPAIIFTDP